MRLLPRFSLRFALLALTIFLIVFGVSVSYWRAYEEHERVATKLETLGFTVEEEADTLFGYIYAKRLTGLQGSFHDDTANVVAALRELPNRRALRRLSCDISYSRLYDSGNSVGFVLPIEAGELAQYPALLRVLGSCTGLEVLDLSIPRIEAGQLQELASLKKLQTLLLFEADLSPDELPRLLPQLPELRHLRIIATGKDVADELLRTPLPRLTLLSLAQRGPIRELALTKQGLGRMPLLDVLHLDEVAVTNIEIEAGAMPNLKVLDLSETGSECRIDWAKLLQAAPKLKMLAMQRSHLNAENAALLSAAPALEHLHLSRFPREEEVDELLARWEREPTSYEFAGLPVAEIATLKKNRPTLKFYTRAADLVWIDHELTFPDFLTGSKTWKIEHPRTLTQDPTGCIFF